MKDEGDATKLEGENNANLSADSDKVLKPRDEDARIMERRDKGDDSIADRHENCDILFSQDLIVRTIQMPAPVRSTETEVNFKRFRKVSSCKLFFSILEKLYFLFSTPHASMATR